MSLIAELRRRNVFKVAMAYLALGWVVTQVAATMAPYMRLPEWTVPMIITIGVIGFPCVLLFSWVYELTPEGLKRESEIDRSTSITHVTGKRLDYTIIALLVAAIAMVALDRFVPREAAEGTAVGAGKSNGPRDSLVAEDRGHGPLPQEAAQTAIASDEKSIAVLPFVNMSEDKANEYFSDGISEELLNLLAKIPELRVIARTSSFAFKGKEADIAEIAAKLHVAHVLEGSVRKSGNKVRITAQLVRTTDSTHLWSETYDRSLDDIFVVQEEIARVVVGQLRIALLGAAPKVREVDPKAYPIYLQARALGRQFTPEGYGQSNELLKQVVEIDPGYAPAWRVLAVNYLNQSLDGLIPAEQANELSREAVQKALAADPDFAPAYSTLGTTRMYNLDFAGAAREMQRALELDPGDLVIVGNAGNLLTSLGRAEQAIAINEFLTARDPVNTVAFGNLGNANLAARRFDAAITAYQTSLRLSPGNIGMEQASGVALLLKGDMEGALQAMQREQGEAQRLCGLTIVQHALGNKAASNAALGELIAKFSESQPMLAAEAMAFLGDADQAFALLDKGRVSHHPQMTIALVDPLLVSLHRDPRWLELLRQMGLAPEQLAQIVLEVKLPGTAARVATEPQP